MNHTKKWTVLLASAVLLVSVSACAANNNNTENAGSQPPSQSAGVSPAAESPAASEAVKDPLPETKAFAISLEGNEEKRTAKLAEADGYALYVFDMFSFDPALGLLTMNVDKNYYARIEKLPAGYNLADIRTQAQADLAKVGDVRELKGDEISPSLGGAALLMIGSNDKLTQQVIVKEVDGTAFRVDVNMPVGEPSEGFGPHAYLSISSLTSR